MQADLYSDLGSPYNSLVPFLTFDYKDLELNIMPTNIIKLIVASITLTVALVFLGLQIFPSINFEGYANDQQFAFAIGAGALIASLAIGLFLLVKPYSLPIKKQTLFVGNLAFRASERELRNLFSQCGEVFSIRLMTDKITRIYKMFTS